jgi:hypothetical protein
MRLDSCGGVHNRYIPSLSATSYDRPEVDNGCHVTIAWRNHPVSDRALKVAAFRALESECPDSFVHDPFASRLASERGMAMLRGLPQPEMMRLGIGVRCRFMDELPLEALASKPITTVLSVGCGLDTRPWRLELSPDPRWIEVDFADIPDYKDTLMSAQTLRCRRERITADLNDAVQRRIIYAAAGPAPALMITEGLLTVFACCDGGSAGCRSLAGERHRVLDERYHDDYVRESDQYGHAARSERNVQASDFLQGELSRTQRAGAFGHRPVVFSQVLGIASDIAD